MSKLYDKSTQVKLNKVIKERLPSFAGSFFRANKDSMTELSLYAYSLDMAKFFEYIQLTKNIPVLDITIKDFASFTELDIENYMDYSKIAVVNGKERPRSNKSLRRRYAILHSFYNFYYITGVIDSIPTLRVIKPKEISKAPTILSQDRVNALIEYVMNGELNSKKKADFQAHLRERDAAIVLLLSYAGLKTSEIVNLNISDLYLEEKCIVIQGRKHSKICISDIISNSLSMYLSKRLEIIAQYGHDNALFLSIQCTRISDRSLQYMIKKYSTDLFGEENKLVAHDLTFYFRNTVYNSTHSLDKTAELSGCHTYSVYKVYKADIDEKLNTCI